jgi:hypothetical protein
MGGGLCVCLLDNGPNLLHDLGTRKVLRKVRWEDKTPGLGLASTEHDRCRPDISKGLSVQLRHAPSATYGLFPRMASSMGTGEQ